MKEGASRPARLAPLRSSAFAAGAGTPSGLRLHPRVCIRLKDRTSADLRALATNTRLRAGISPARHSLGGSAAADPITDLHRYAGHFYAASRSGPSAGYLRSVVESTPHALSATGAGSVLFLVSRWASACCELLTIASEACSTLLSLARTLERDKGIEPPCAAWKAAAQPMGQSRVICWWIARESNPVALRATDLQSAAVANAARDP